jgi:transmembrane sensor
MTDKGNILAFPDTAAIEAEAAAWVARFDAGDVSAKDQAAFQQWLGRSSLHRDIIAEYGNLWSEFDALRPLTGGEAGAGQRAPAGDPGWTRGVSWRAACAAAVIVAVGGLAAFQIYNRGPGGAGSYALAAFSYETAIGAQKKIILADGSTLMLNTNSRVDVNFSGNRRDIHLIRGEAYFDVVHDNARPFTVYAKDYVVRDIGTAFDVHLSKAGVVEVGVTKGSVEVAPAEGSSISGVGKGVGILTAGQNVVLGQTAERTETISSTDMGRKLAWRQGQLIYTGQPLGEVVADISRYSDIKIELADPSLEKLPVGGAFRTDQIDAIFAALENNFGVHAEWLDAQHVRFTASADKPAANN